MLTFVTPLSERLGIRTFPAEGWKPIDEQRPPADKQEMANYIAWHYGWYVNPKDFIEFEHFNWETCAAVEIRDPQLIVAMTLRRVWALVKWYWEP